MKVASGCVVTLAYDICTEDGEIVESSELNGPVSFVYGRGAIIPGLDKQVLGLEPGQERSFSLPPQEAFGRIEDAPKKVLKRSEFPTDAKLANGERFQAGMSGGHKITLEIVSSTTDEITVRLLHPLAGKTVTMNVVIKQVRDATAAERESGSVQYAPPPIPKGAS